MMITEIGIVAGKILTLLEDLAGPVSLKEVVVLLKEDEDLVLMSAGWLVREGYVRLDRNEGVLLIELQEEQMFGKVGTGRGVTQHLLI